MFKKSECKKFLSQLSQLSQNRPIFFSCAQEFFLVCTPVKNGEWRALMAGKYYEMICDFHVVFWYEVK